MHTTTTSVTVRAPAKSAPYLYNYYNVVLYFPSPTSHLKSLLARLYNAIIEGLNSKVKLSRYVFILPDADLIKDMDLYDCGISDMLHIIIKWLVTNVGKAFEIRREQLQRLKPGALGTTTEPRLIWLAMVARPFIEDKNFSKIFKARFKFNTALEAVLFESKYNHMMYLDNVKECHHFDQWGNLTQSGKTEMWKEINQQMMMFDEHTSDLRPCKPKAQQATGSRGNKQIRRKLPKPSDY